MAEAGLDVDIVPTESEDEARTAVAEALAQGADLIVAAGGDGTIGRVAEQLLGTDVTLGILPLGSVMNIPRMLGLPREIGPAAMAIAAARRATIDVGVANGRGVLRDRLGWPERGHFHRRAALRGRRLGLAASRRSRPRFAIGRRGWRSSSTTAAVATRALMVTASNGAYTGVGMTVAPDARLDDGKFDVRVFRHFSKLELLRHLASIMFGRRRYSPHVRTYRSATVRINGRRQLPCRADSHDLGTTPLECRVRPASLSVIVGPDYADGRSVEGS